MKHFLHREAGGEWAGWADNDIKNLPGHSLGHPALGLPVWVGFFVKRLSFVPAKLNHSLCCEFPDVKTEDLNYVFCCEQCCCSFSLSSSSSSPPPFFRWIKAIKNLRWKPEKKPQVNTRLFGLLDKESEIFQHCMYSQILPCKKTVFFSLVFLEVFLHYSLEYFSNSCCHI